MSQARYLPAIHTQARSLPLGPLTIRTADDRELGRLMGFVIGPEENHISRLVLEVDGARQVALPMVPLRFDVDAQALRLTSAEIPVDERLRGQSPSPRSTRPICGFRSSPAPPSADPANDVPKP